MNTNKDYWETRCELAEKYINESPCDPDILTEQLVAYTKWCDFKKLTIPVVSKSFYCIDAEDRLNRCKKQCMHCTRLETI